MKKDHLKLGTAVIMFFMATQLSAIQTETEKDINEHEKNAKVELSTTISEVSATNDSTAKANLVINVDQAQAGQDLAIKSTQAVSDYGDDSGLYLLLLLLLLGVPVVVVVW